MKGFANVLTAVVAPLVLATSTTIANNNPISPDASWWAKVPPSARLAVIVGAISAYKEAYAGGQLSVSMHDLPPRATFSRSYAYYVDAVTNFYATHPDLKGNEIGNILDCLSDVPPTYLGYCKHE